MGEWVETPYGRRYKEEYGTTTAFFMTAPNENGKRFIPNDVLAILLEDIIEKLDLKDNENE